MSQFPEEPLDLSTEQGFGYFAAYPGLLLKEGRYEIIRKLGFGPRSSVWLASDLQSVSGLFVALKLLTTHATAEKSQELSALQAISLGADSDNLPVLRDHFTEQSHHGEHQCFALDPLGPDLDTFRQTSPTRSLKVHTVKKVVASAVEALCDFEELDIIHGGTKPDIATALKADNLLFWVSEGAVNVQPIVDASLPSGVQKDVTVDGKRYPVVRSEPCGNQWHWDDDNFNIANYSIYLNNLGHTTGKGKDASWDTSVDPSLRPPEVILGTGFDIKIDTWMLGCATYYLLTGRPLFEEGLDDIQHLARMQAITEDFLDPAISLKSKRVKEFFDADGTLRYIHSMIHLTIYLLQAELTETGCVSEEDIPAVVEFLQECLSLDPEDRPSAPDLFGNAWLRSGYACSCGYCP
ncbi:kinase-like domain-containing protein [Lyophyllum atratum]|nr:kinase-like domain-containing protein [Lyophyllum atratum]